MIYPKAVTPDTKAIPGKTFALAISLNVFVQLAYSEEIDFVCVFSYCDERRHFRALCNTARPEYVEELGWHLQELYSIGYGLMRVSDRDTPPAGGIRYFDPGEVHDKLGDLCYRLS